DPTEQMFRQMFEIFAPKLGFPEVDSKSIDYLIDRHYRRVNRPFRCCQPRDLLLQVRNYCVYNDLPLELKTTYFDFAAGNYFTVMSARASAVPAPLHSLGDQFPALEAGIELVLMRSGHSLVARGNQVELVLGQVLDVDQLVPRLIDRQDQLVELQVDRL